MRALSQLTLHNNGVDNYVIKKSNNGYIAATYNGATRIDFLLLAASNLYLYYGPYTGFTGETLYDAEYYVGQAPCSHGQWNSIVNCYKMTARADFLDGTSAKYRPELKTAGTKFDGTAGYPNYESHYRVDVDLYPPTNGDYIKQKDSNCGSTWTELSFEITTSTLCGGQAWRVLDQSVVPPAVSPSIGFDPTPEATTKITVLKYHSGELDPTAYHQELGWSNVEAIGRSSNIDLVVWLDIEEQAASAHCMPGNPCVIFGAWITNFL